MCDIQAGEYGVGHARSHAELFADALVDLGIDPTPNAHIDLCTGPRSPPPTSSPSGHCVGGCGAWCWGSCRCSRWTRSCRTGAWSSASTAWDAPTGFVGSFRFT
ncbi:MAG: hypothetical protein IPH29_03850 [Candidatus Microthrix sp.]|nr:hypothetical protein [Candidatus Microthrix sp.]